MPEGYTTKVRPEKVEAVDRIRSEIGSTQAVVLTEYRGLSVNDLADLRARLGAEETSYRVVKNTLARIAVSDLGLGELNELLVGPTAIAYVRGDPVAAAKVLAAFAREHPELVIKGGVLDGRVLSAEDAKALSTVDTLDVSRAKIAGLLTAPLRQLMMLLEAPAARMIYVLEQLGKREPGTEQAGAEQAGAEQPAAEQAEQEPTEKPEEGTNEGSSDGEG